MNGECEKDYTSHYVLVKHKKATSSVCSKEQLENLEGVQTYFPIEGEEEPTGDEIVLFDRFVFDVYSIDGVIL